LHSILIVDDSQVIRRSLRSWIEQTMRCKVCGEAENGQAALEKVDELRPDIVIMDFQMPVMNGLDASRNILRHFPGTAIVMFTLHPSKELMRAAQEAGVRDVVSKTDRPSDRLSVAVQQILS
jgi:DNA-binding NarL/FixJ family response regulator